MTEVANSVKQVNFPELMDRLLSLLTEKEQNIIKRRFSLGLKKKETLDKIGKSYSITRERVRQIEAVAIKKLARISMDPHMQLVHGLAEKVLGENGGVMLEDSLFDALYKKLGEPKNFDMNSLKLALRVSNRFVLHEKTINTRPFWRLADTPLSSIRETTDVILKLLKKQGDEVMTAEEVAKEVTVKGDKSIVASLLEIDNRFITIGEKWGLANCRLINPKSIRDRITIVLKKDKKPLHFRTIIERVHKEFPSRKKVTPQAVHNELIRHDEFVLVGRGEYGLKNWGMVAGTVCDVIIQVIKENGGPMKRKDIIDGVLAKRDIRIGTISLNLQKYDFFKRVGRAVYDYVPEMDKRRRNQRSK